MSKLSVGQIQILRLIMRSKKGEDGWYRVSRPVWPLVDGCLPTDIAETKTTVDDEGGFVRLTELSEALANYIEECKHADGC